MGTCLRRDRDGGKRLNPHEASERCPNNARSRGSLQDALTTFTSWRDRAGRPTDGLRATCPMATRALLPVGVPRRDGPAQARFEIDVRLRRVRRYRSSRSCAGSGCRTSASTNVTMTHCTQTIGSGGAPRPTAIRPPTRWSPRPTTWTSITRRSASPESITRSTSRSGTTTAAAGDRPQSVDPGPVSNHAVLGRRHIALAAEDLLQAHDLVDVASIDAEGLASTMAYHGGDLIGPIPGNNQLEAGTEGAFALEDFQLDRYR